MDISRTERDDALTRLRRAHGQLGGLIHMVEDGRDSTEVLTLLAGVTHALHQSAAFRLVGGGLQRCHDDPGGAGDLNIGAAGEAVPGSRLT